MKRVLAALILGGLATTANAEGVDINLSSDALHGAFTGSLTNLFPRLNGLYEIGGMTGERSGFDYTEANAGLLVSGDAGAQQATVTAGLGGRFAFVDWDGTVTGEALALGGMIDARLPAFNRIGVIAYAYGAPKASSFGDLKSYVEWAVDGDYQVLQSASLYVGYRQLKVGVENAGTGSVDKGWHVGLRLAF